MTTTEQVLADDKRRALAALRRLEAEQRAEVACLRERLDRGESLRGVPAQIVSAEAKAVAYMTAVDVVEGTFF